MYSLERKVWKVSACFEKYCKKLKRYGSVSADAIFLLVWWSPGMHSGGEITSVATFMVNLICAMDTWGQEVEFRFDTAQNDAGRDFWFSVLVCVFCEGVSLWWSDHYFLKICERGLFESCLVEWDFTQCFTHSLLPSDIKDIMYALTLCSQWDSHPSIPERDLDSES